MVKQAADGTPVGELCRKAGMSDATFYNWRKKFAGLIRWTVKRLRQLEDENAKAKRIVADLTLDKAMLQDVLSKSSEACPQAPACRHDQGGLEGLDPACLCRREDQSVVFTSTSPGGVSGPN